MSSSIPQLLVWKRKQEVAGSRVLPDFSTSALTWALPVLMSERAAATDRGGGGDLHNEPVLRLRNVTGGAKDKLQRRVRSTVNGSPQPPALTGAWFDASPCTDVKPKENLTHLFGQQINILLVASLWSVVEFYQSQSLGGNKHQLVKPLVSPGFNRERTERLTWVVAVIESTNVGTVEQLRFSRRPCGE